MINGIILAGGLSKRMGTDKGLLMLDDKTMVEHLYEKLSPVCKSIILVTNKPEDYQEIADRLNMLLVTDVIKQLGPLSGVHAGLGASDADYNMVLACDMPNANPAKFIEFSKQAMKEGAQLIVAEANDGRYHSLHAIYHKDCQFVIEQQLMKYRLKISELINLVSTYIMQADEIGAEMFFNMNTPEEYLKTEKNH
jgi:molybdopterin-guanine dinucleotide biosynthesis protein A